MKKMALIIAFVLVSFISIFAQDVNDKEIKDRDIEWSDFVGEVDKSSNFDAYTTWLINYAYDDPTFVDNKARVEVTVRLFLKSNSWVRPDKKTPRLLNHERGHFKIARLCANQFKKTINSTAFDRDKYVKQIDDWFQEILGDCKVVEKLYDKETEHYFNEEQQAIWDKRLDDALKQ